MTSDDKELDSTASSAAKYSADAAATPVGDGDIPLKLKPEQHLLIQARNTLYQHISQTSSSGTFFMQQDRTHKRELVAVMRGIDNQKIASVHQLFAEMQQLANKHQSETFNTLLQAIHSILKPHLDADAPEIPPEGYQP